MAVSKVQRSILKRIVKNGYLWTATASDGVMAMISTMGTMTSQVVSMATVRALLKNELIKVKRNMGEFQVYEITPKGKKVSNRNARPVPQNPPKPKNDHKRA